MHITHQPIPVEAFLKEKPADSCGASVHFIGTVRNYHGGRFVIRLNYECYEVLANKEIARIAREVQEKYHCSTVRIIHRVGMLEVGEIAVAIYVSSAHRDEAFRACRETIERIKQTVPIWKQEFYQDGTSEWVLCGHPHEICHDF